MSKWISFTFLKCFSIARPIRPIMFHTFQSMNTDLSAQPLLFIMQFSEAVLVIRDVIYWYIAEMVPCDWLKTCHQKHFTVEERLHCCFEEKNLKKNGGKKKRRRLVTAKGPPRFKRPESAHLQWTAWTQHIWKPFTGPTQLLRNEIKWWDGIYNAVFTTAKHLSDCACAPQVVKRTTRRGIGSGNQ